MKKKIPQDLNTLIEKYEIGAPKEAYTQEEIDQLIRKVEAKIENKKRGRLELVNQGNKLFLENMMQIILKGIAIAATEMGQSRFSFDLTLHMIVGSGLTTQFFETFAKIVSTKDEKTIAKALELAALLTAIYSGTKGNEDHIASLIDAFSDKLEPMCDALQGYPGISEELSLKLAAGKLALLNGEPSKFILICKTGLEDFLEKNLKEAAWSAKTLKEAISNREESVTTIAQAM